MLVSHLISVRLFKKKPKTHDSKAMHRFLAQSTKEKHRLGGTCRAMKDRCQSPAKGTARSPTLCSTPGKWPVLGKGSEGSFSDPTHRCREKSAEQRAGYIRFSA